KRLTLAAATFLIGYAPQASPAQTMSVPAKFGVSATGAATYSVAISVPPGTAGMTPKLSLEYNSQSGNGLLGMGWSLGGLSSISRCPRTTAQDGVAGGVNFDANDRFCMDGQRLVVIGGTYGADGSEYRTEIETFSKIIAHGTAGSGPAWFEVHTRSGQILQFGNTADSRLVVQGATTARVWALNRVSDSKTNYFTVTYTNDSANGQLYPSRIDYTGNSTAGLAPPNSVQLFNKPRPDVVPQYQGGSLSQLNQRLSDIRIFAGAALVFDYWVGYQQSSSTGQSLVQRVGVCAQDGSSCQPLPTTNFSWSDMTVSQVG